MTTQGQRHARSTSGTRGASRRPRILLVTPEISYLPEAMGVPPSAKLCAKAGGLADVAASLVHKLSERGADVHVALPHYRQLFEVDPSSIENDCWRDYKRKPSDARVHLAEDRVFYYRDRIYDRHGDSNPHLALAFQREVVNNIIPRVQPDLIHCHDWMTGLVPAAARRLNIPCLFTVHNIHSERVTLAEMEDRGLDAAEIWQSLYFERMPENYWESREHNPVDLLASGLFAAGYVNTVSGSFLDELTSGGHDFVPAPVRAELCHKQHAGRAAGILNSPDASYDPETDIALALPYGSDNARLGKHANKLVFQEEVGLAIDADAPLFFWPSRLDPVQKGPGLLTHILHESVRRYADCGMQIALVADGPFQQHFHDIVSAHGLHGRVAVRDFDERLSRLGYAASDFTLMPSRFEPCGLSQMVAAKYGSLPIVHHTGGLRDSVAHLDASAGCGNGFVFNHHDAEGLRWAMGEAMALFCGDRRDHHKQVRRVMRESAQRFNADVAFNHYREIYESLAGRSVCDSQRASVFPVPRAKAC